MKRTILTSTALALIFAGPVMAAPKKPQVDPPLPESIYGWTGWYVGGNIGYSWGHSDISLNGTSSGGIFLGSGANSLRPVGVIGGLQAGYNWQTSRNWVWGLEIDFQWTGQDDQLTEAGSVAAPMGTGTGTGSITARSSLIWLGTTRGRFGIVMDGRPDVVWYITGGLAYGRVKTSLDASASGTFTTPPTSNCEGGCSFSSALPLSDTKIQVGWTLGAGVEGTLANRWNWKLEYLYVDLGNTSGTVPVTGLVHSLRTSYSAPLGGIVTYSNSMTDNIIRVGLNYRLGP
jgi:outer membrane immunogenic protein